MIGGPHDPAHAVHDLRVVLVQLEMAWAGLRVTMRQGSGSKGGDQPMIFQDDRTPEQKQTHTLIVMMPDRCLSGWGMAEGGPSYAGWAFQDGELSQVESWVRQRTDAMRVRVVFGDYRPPAGPGHCHIYVWDGKDRA